MLRRVSGDRYEAGTDEQIQIVAKSQGNDGVNNAGFEYAGTVLPRETIQGLPGCTFTVKDGRKQFQAVVVFADHAGVSARYDLFEVDEVGGLSDLEQHVTAIDSAPLVGLAVEGVAVPSAAVRRRARPARKQTKRRTRRGRKPRRKAAPKRQAATKSRAKTKPGKRRGKRSKRATPGRTRSRNRR